MRLFDDPNYEKFFNPLCCKNKKIYYECILQLIEKSREVPLLYENDAKDTLILYFRNLTYAVAEEDNSGNADENISTNKTETENASAVLRYFRHCGWLSERELGRNGDNIATVTPYCMRVIESIDRVFNRDNSAILTNHIFSIYDTLKSAFDPEHGRTVRPYTNILIPLSESVADLINELMVLKDSISSIMRFVIKMTETNDLGQFLIKNEVMEKFFSDYFFIKKDGMIPGYIDEIEKMLYRINKEEVYINIIKEYQEINNIPEIQAREYIEREFSNIRAFISYEYVKQMDSIDKKINMYYHLYSTRIYMVLSNSVNVQAFVNNLLMSIKIMEPEEKNEFFNIISENFDLTSYRYIGERSIARRKKRNPNRTRSKVIKSDITEEERNRLTYEALYKYPDKYSMKNTKEYFNNKLGQKQSILTDNNTVQTREDAMMVASCIIYSGTSGFPFAVEFLDGTVETNVATISKIRIKRVGSYE